MRRRLPLLPRLAAVALSLVMATAACGGGDGDGDVGEERADQVRIAATEAGLSEAVADALALAARADDATFQVEYPGTDGARVVVSQSPPNRRVDVVQGDVVISSRVLRGDTAYACETKEGAKPGTLTCTRAAGALDAPGTFTIEALKDFADAVAASKDRLEVHVQERQVAGIQATCIVATPKEGTELDGSDPGTSELCLSPEGAQLLRDQGQERVVADEYRTEVPKGTFDVDVE